MKKISTFAVIATLAIATLSVTSFAQDRKSKGPAPVYDSVIMLLLRNNPDARRFIPKDFTVLDERGQLCDESGAAVNVRGGRCWKISDNSSPSSLWVIRSQAGPGAGVERIFKVNSSGGLVLWRRYDQQHVGSVNAVMETHPDALQYAEMREGATQVAKEPTEAGKDASAVAKDQQDPAEALKKGVQGILGILRKR